MNRPLAIGAMTLALFSALPAAAEDVDYDLAIKRLRACATAGGGSIPHDSLNAALVAVRSLCRPQIDRAYAAAEGRADAANPRADADQRAALHRETRRRIDYDLALLVARMTGLQS